MSSRVDTCIVPVFVAVDRAVQQGEFLEPAMSPADSASKLLSVYSCTVTGMAQRNKFSCDEAVGQSTIEARKGSPERENSLVVFWVLAICLLIVLSDGSR